MERINNVSESVEVYNFKLHEHSQTLVFGFELHVWSINYSHWGGLYSDNQSLTH
jgi:hypothetical protein